jgi:exonuclease SbcC
LLSLSAAGSVMIKKIVLENFMSHAHTVIEPAHGLTVLVGPNNCGKSAVVEALRAVCENTKTDFMVRHGEKEAIVTIETDDGHVISWHRRKKGASYIIDGLQNDRPDGDFLEKVHRLLKLPKVKASENGDEFDVHFGEQKSPIFLLNESGTRAATFFASSSDAERLLQMQRLHRQKAAEDKKEEQRRTTKLAGIDSRLATLSPLDEIEPELAVASDRHRQILADLAKTERLEELGMRLAHTSRRLARHNARREATQSLAAPPLLQNEEAIDRLIRRYQGALRRRDLATKQAAALANVSAPPVLADAKAMDLALERRRVLETRVRRLSAMGVQLSDLRQPPVAADTTALSNRIAALRRSIGAHDHAAAKCGTLAHLPQPPPMVDSKPIADQIDRLRSAQSALARRRQIAGAAANQLAEAERSIEIWANQNPVCPVCNGVVDASRLLSSAGEHSHV